MIVGVAGVAAGFFLANYMSAAPACASTTCGLGRHRRRRLQQGSQCAPWGSMFCQQQGTSVAYDTTPCDDTGYC